jgi:hypothetical protein
MGSVALETSGDCGRRPTPDAAAGSRLFEPCMSRASDVTSPLRVRGAEVRFRAGMREE